MTTAVDRGGPFIRSEAPPRNWMRAAAPGIAVRLPADESSPIGGGFVRDVRSIKLGRMRHLAPMLLIGVVAMVGSMSFGHGAYMFAKAELAQILLQSAWARTLSTGTASPPWPWADTHPVARLIVPARHADVLVLAGASGRTLAFGPGHLDGSAAPGDAGNAVVTAHRDTHFRFLQRVAAGDELVVERPDGAKRHFRVRNTYVADHRALNLPRDTARPTLTLVTCYPFEALNPGGPLRYVVVAEAV